MFQGVCAKEPTKEAALYTDSELEQLGEDGASRPNGDIERCMGQLEVVAQGVSAWRRSDAM
jgi:hypothetical protein